jgi:hypothetical protein
LIQQKIGVAEFILASKSYGFVRIYKILHPMPRLGDMHRNARRNLALRTEPVRAQGVVSRFTYQRYLCNSTALVQRPNVCSTSGDEGDFLIP